MRVIKVRKSIDEFGEEFIDFGEVAPPQKAYFIKDVNSNDEFFAAVPDDWEGLSQFPESPCPPTVRNRFTRMGAIF